MGSAGGTPQESNPHRPCPRLLPTTCHTSFDVTVRVCGIGLLTRAVTFNSHRGLRYASYIKKGDSGLIGSTNGPAEVGHGIEAVFRGTTPHMAPSLAPGVVPTGLRRKQYMESPRLRRVG